jgi:hypothetical protein
MLICACTLCLIASGAVLTLVAVAQTAAAGMAGSASGGGPSGDSADGRVAENSVPLPGPDRDPAARSAKAIECAQKADARGLLGKQRRRFLHECRSGV